MEAIESRWLYTSRSSSTERRACSLVRGTRGAELVRVARPGRTLVRGVVFGVDGEAGMELSPPRCSLDDFKLLLDLVRWGAARSRGTSISPIKASRLAAACSYI